MRWIAHQRLVHQATKAIDIGSLVEFLAQTLFRTHINRAAKNLAGFRKSLLLFARNVHDLCNAEVDQLYKLGTVVLLD